MCGASSQQKQEFQQQQQLQQQLTSQSQQIFGDSAGAFTDIMNAFSPILAAGPGQQGFSLPEKAALNSEAITDTGLAYKHAKQAVGENEAAQGGGTIALPSGVKTAQDTALAGQGAAQTASALTNIQEKNYDVGRQNFMQAAQEVEGATGEFNPATSAGGAATSSGEAAANTANQIAASNNSWVTAVTGALGGIAGDVTAGYTAHENNN